MKRIMCLAVAAMTLSVTVPAFAAEMTKEQKNECLLQSKGCLQEVDSIKQKVKKLDAEIKKGKKVYTPEEIKALNAKLQEAEAMLDSLMKAQ